MRRVNRRDVLKMGAAAGAGLAFGREFRSAGAQDSILCVLSPQRPDPVPPGVNDFGNDLITTWQMDHNLGVQYETRLFPELTPTAAAEFSAGGYVRDLYYTWATIPDFAASLTEIGSRLPSDLLDDLPSSQAVPLSWNGQQYGIAPTLSLLLLFSNRDTLEVAGIAEPPATWDELKAMTANFSGERPGGLLLPYGARAGIGGIASIWMAFLQQAGGRMYDDDRQPVFDDAPGVDALQFMIDLLPMTAPESFSFVGYNDVAFGMKNRMAAMTFSFPAFWGNLNGGAPAGEGQFIPSVMPKGPENNATISGADAWTLANASPNQDQALQLLEFYLSPEVQKRQLFETRWLPSRLSVLSDPEMQAANPVASVLLEQAQSPFDSFITPNYMAITNVLGEEIRNALLGHQSASQALTNAKSAIQPLIVW